MTTEATANGYRLPKSLRGRWLSPMQLIWAIPMIGLTWAVSRTGSGVVITIVFAAVTLLGWTPFTTAPGYLMPWKFIQRAWMWKRRQIIYTESPSQIVRDESEPSTRSLSQAMPLRHTVLPFVSHSSGDQQVIGLFTGKNHATTYLEIRGMRYTGTDPEARFVGQDIVTGAFKDVANAYQGKLQIAQIAVVGPDDYEADLAFLAGGWGADPTHIGTDSTISAVRANVEEATIISGAIKPQRLISVNSGFPNSWKPYLGKGILDPTRNSFKKPLTETQVMGENPFALSESIKSNLEPVAPDIRTLDLLDQIALIHGAMDPTEAEEVYSRLAEDREQFRSGSANSLNDFSLVRLGAFPRSCAAGHDWIRLGRSVHRILIVNGHKRRLYPADYFEAIMKQLGLPGIVSTVWETQPGRWEERRREEKFMLTRDILGGTRGGDYGGTKRSQERAAEADIERDEMYDSQAPGADCLQIYISSGADLGEVNRSTKIIRDVLSSERIRAKVVTGAENQWPFFLHALNLARL